VRHQVFKRRLPNLGALLERGANRFADRPYLVDQDLVLTFSTAAKLVRATAASLANEHRIGKSDRVAMVAANRYEYVIVAWAITILGGVIVSLNGWWTQPELEYGIQLTEPTLVIGDTPRLARLAGTHLDVPRRDMDEACPGWFAANGSSFEDVPIEEDDPFVVLFTSGTTGRPKAAVLTHRNQLHWMQSIELRQAAAGAVPREACELAALPLFHISGLNAQAISSVGSGTTLAYLPSGRWSPEEHLRVSEEHGVTTWRLVPTQAWRLLDSPDIDRYELSSLRSIVGGGSIWSPTLLEALSARWPQARPGLVVGLGMTETNGTGATAVMPGLLARPGNVGGPPPAARIRICRSTTDEQVEDGVAGEIQIRSASVFTGYLNDPGGTEAALAPDGWYRTGDFGLIDGGVLFLEGRRSDLILRGGENIYPAEIEDRLLAHPDVLDAVVVGVEDRVLGQEVKTVVVVREGSELDKDSIQGWVAAALASFKVPTYVEFRESLPRNATGKVIKHLLDADQVPSLEDE
jgi:acyl-CoA synthetase (AMP-forming)/AMP-acid ligase II